MTRRHSDSKLVDWFFRLRRFAKGLHDKAINVAAPNSPAPEPPHWSSTPDGHTKTLALGVCECGNAKSVGWYRCNPCIEKHGRGR